MKAVAKNISFREYVAHEAENNSGLKHMGKSAKEYLYRKTHSRDDTEALSIGRHVHTCVLEPELFEKNVAVWRGAKTLKGEWSTHKSTKAYKEFLADAQENDLEILDAAEHTLCTSIREAVKSNQAAQGMLNQADKEVSIFWQHRFGLRCKMRADILRTGVNPFLADLKTCQDASPDGFARAAAKYEYHVQLGMYQSGVEALTGLLVPVYILAVEKTAPFDTALYQVPQAALDVGRSIFEDRLAKVAKCKETGEWPGVQVGIGTLEMPNWVFEEEAGTLLIGGVEVSV